MPNHHIFSYLKRIVSPIVFFLALGIAKSYAYAPEHYAESSVLSEGNWGRIEVSETGMQFISDAVLNSLGFPEPEKVNVYGYGGEMIPETLASPDDLPIMTSIRVNGGIVFFGKGNVSWAKNPYVQTTYAHTSNPYSDHAYYFVSDREPERKNAVKAEDTESASGNPVTEFWERLVHEQDLWMPMHSGRLMLGEDFKTVTSRSFQFALPGNLGQTRITTQFGCKTTSGTSRLTFTANGEELPFATTDQMNFSSTKLIVTTKTTKEIADGGEMLDFNIKFNGSGTVNMAGLDYIEVEYSRQIRMENGELHFYIEPANSSEVIVEGASNATVVWDVTDPTDIKEMPVRVAGSTLTFVSEPGYREYVAFETGNIKRGVAAAGKIENQNLHSLPAPGMLVISPKEYLSAAQRLVELHKQTDGIEVLALTPEEIYNEFSSGKADVSAFRKILKMWYDRAEGREGEYPLYCLIMSRPTYDNKMVTPVVRNAGYPRVPIWQSATGDSETSSYSTDDYVGMMRDVTGVFNIGTEPIHISVARMPVKSLNEANSAIDKLEEYLLNPDYGSWRNNVMVIADDQDDGVHLQQAEDVIAMMKSEGKGNQMLYEKLYLDAYPLEYTGKGASYPLAHERMMNKWNEGTVLIDYIGHANPKSWGHEYLLTWTDINAMKNERLPFIYAATCEFLRWDADDMSGAEVLWLLPKSGVIGMISPSREVLINSNGVLNRSVAKYIFMEDEDGNTLTVGEIMRRGKNESNTGTNKLRYGLIGDPTLRLPWAGLNVKVDKINGQDLEDAEDLPVLSARSSVTLSGHIEDKAGNKLEDFSGITEVALFDAEKVITTNGNGSDGVVSTYNDRKIRLFVGRTKVTDGEWSITFTMPTEIENNYSPALLSFYATDSQGREASGAEERLYVYGYDTEAPEDFEGPKIIEFYLNSPSFASGNEVSPNPVLTARFYDESGISVSEAGIGHNITLDLDGKKYYEDVSEHYIPDDSDSGAGSLTYPLGDVAYGNHTLRLTVWDNANNSTTATIDFSISVLWKPTISVLTTDVNPASSNVNFIIATDGATNSMECRVEVYDIWGKKVWQDTAPSFSGSNYRTTLGWDLTDFGGARVQGGIYLYRATVKTDSGATVSKTKKLMVSPN